MLELLRSHFQSKRPQAMKNVSLREMDVVRKSKIAPVVEAPVIANCLFFSTPSAVPVLRADRNRARNVERHRLRQAFIARSGRALPYAERADSRLSRCEHRGGMGRSDPRSSASGGRYAFSPCSIGPRGIEVSSSDGSVTVVVRRSMVQRLRGGRRGRRPRAGGPAPQNIDETRFSPR
jgi:hypothetical protein